MTLYAKETAPGRPVPDTDAEALLKTVRQFAVDAEARVMAHHPQWSEMRERARG
jgi:hypothetical protein